MVRIVGGRARGLQIAVPKNAPTRPTTDRVREALFNVLAHRFENICHGAQVLDLFAGSGALGLEALSRGAAHVQFVDQSHAAIRQLKLNAQRVGGAYTVSQTNARSFLSHPKTCVDLVFLDPPYGEGLVTPALEGLAEKRWLVDGALVCIECSQARNFTFPSGYSERFERKYGKTTIIILGYTREAIT